MRSNKLFPLFLFLCMSLTACDASGGTLSTPAQESPAGSPAQWEHALATYPVSETLMLVETKGDTAATRFLLYDAETEQAVSLPTLPDCVQFEEVVGQDEFLFTATGQNTESASLNFPYRLHCIRTGDGTQFIRIDEKNRFDLTEQIQAGSPVPCSLAAVVFSFDSVEFLFQPLNEESAADFYAAFSDIPLTTISYAQSEHQLSLFLDDCFPGETFYVCEEALIDAPYLNRWDMQTSELGTLITLTLTSDATGYFAEKSSFQDSWLTVQFD